MIPPHELKAKTFTKVLRGYSTVEVDEQIEFLIEKYTELYRENDELERKLKTAEAKLEAFTGDEESIRTALVNAQRASTKIVDEANERSEIITQSAKANCDKILSDFRIQIRKEEETLNKLRNTVAEFKARMFEQYKNHIEFIEQISPDYEEIFEGASGDVDYVKKVVNNIKDDIAVMVVSGSIGEHDDDEKPSAYIASAAEKMIEAEKVIDDAAVSATADAGDDDDREFMEFIDSIAGEIADSDKK